MDTRLCVGRCTPIRIDIHCPRRLSRKLQSFLIWLNQLVSEDADHIRSLLDMLMMTKSITQAPQPRDTKEELLELADLDISNLCIEGKAI